MVTIVEFCALMPVLVTLTCFQGHIGVGKLKLQVAFLDEFLLSSCKNDSESHVFNSE